MKNTHLIMLVIGFVLIMSSCDKKSLYAQKVLLYYDSIRIKTVEPLNIDSAYFFPFIQGTTEQESRHKLLSPLIIKSTLNGIPIFAENPNDRWPLGTWNSGYYNRWETGFPSYKLTISPCPRNENTGEELIHQGFLSSHPLYSINDKMIRALIHSNHLFPKASWVNENNRKIRSGIDYMIFSQRTSIPITDDFYSNEEGGFVKWFFRPDSLVPNTDEDKLNNYAHLFETSHALRSMCEAYMYFKNDSVSYGSIAGSLYNMVDLYNAIIKAADNIERKSIGYIKEKGSYEEIGCACDWPASNYRGLAVWALTSAYKVAKHNGDVDHANKYYLKAKEISKRIIEFQIANNTLENGMWLTGGSNSDNDGCGHKIYKETYIWYHQLILRGIVEMMDITEDSDIEWKEQILIPSVKRAVNHLIKYRVAYEDVKADKKANWSIAAKSWLDMQKGALRTTFTSIDHKRTIPTWAFYYYEEVLEPIAMLTLYSKYQSSFSLQERTILKNLLITMAIQSHGGYNALDPNTLEKFVQYAYYCDYLNAFEKEQRIYPLHENNSVVLIKKLKK